MKNRARELWDFLVEFVSEEDIPPANGNNGGIILATWSFGGTWMTAFLANLTSFPVNDVDLQGYVRRTILYDPPCHSLGYALPEDKYHPLEDEKIPVEERPLAFSKWVTGYYTHGDSPDQLERRTPVSDPQPSILNMTPEEMGSNFSPSPAGPGGSDFITLNSGIKSGSNVAMRMGAFYFKDDEEVDQWEGVELRYLWCDRSVYEMPWGTMQLRAELDDAKQKELRMRPITIVRLPGANHFAHWDEPERLLVALLAN